MGCEHSYHEKYNKCVHCGKERAISNSALSGGLVAAAEYIEILEKVLYAYQYPTNTSIFGAPSDGDVATAKGKWCAAAKGYRVGEATEAKIAYNKGREHMHGGKRF